MQSAPHLYVHSVIGHAAHCLSHVYWRCCLLFCRRATNVPTSVEMRSQLPLPATFSSQALHASSFELDNMTRHQSAHIPAMHHPTPLKSGASQPSLRDNSLRPSQIPEPNPLRPLSPPKHFLSTPAGSFAARALLRPGANLPASVTSGRKPAAPTVYVQGSTAAQQSGTVSGMTWQVYNSSLAETDTDVAELQYTARISASTQRVARLSPLTTMRDNPLSDSQEDERCPDQLVPTAAASVRHIAADQSQRMTRAASAVAASSACAVDADTVCAAVPKNRPAKSDSVTDSAPLAAAMESSAPVKAGSGCPPTAAAAKEQPPRHAANASSTHAVVPSEEAAVAQDVAPAKRNRGRPPKAAPKEAVAPEQTSKRAATAQPSTRHATATATAVSKVKKRRLPKATANDDQKAEDIAAVKVSSTAQEPRDVAAVKPRRGKAAKATAVEDVPGQTGSAQLSTAPGVLPVTAAVPKPKRGRPRKVTTDIEQSSGDLTAGRLDSTSQVAKDAAPAKPRRGRPPKASAASDQNPKTVAPVKPADSTVHAAAELVAVPKVERGQPSKASATRDAAAVKPNSNTHAAIDASAVPKAKSNRPPKVPAASEQMSSNTPLAALALPVPEPKQRRAPQVAAASEHDSGNGSQPRGSSCTRSAAQPKAAQGGTAPITTRGGRPEASSASQAADSSTCSANTGCSDQATLAPAAASSEQASLSATAPRQDPTRTSSAVPEVSGGLRGGTDPLQVLAMAAAAAGSGGPPQQSLPQPFTFRATSSRYTCYTAPASVAVSSPLVGVFKARRNIIEVPQTTGHCLHICCAVAFHVPALCCSILCITHCI